MSHVESVETRILNLDALKAACENLGVEFREGQRKYEFFGRSVGDYPLPAGFTAEDLGKCDHAIHVPGVNYEIGVVRAKDGSPGYSLLYDFWGSGGKHDGTKLLEKFGKGLVKLVDRYSVEVLRAKARAKGYLSTEKIVNGKTQVMVTIP